MPDTRVSPSWPERGQRTAPSWYVECLRNALRRVAVVLNSEGRSAMCRAVDLSCSDDDLERIFAKNKRDREIIQLNIAEEDPHTLDDEYRAEYFFYCSVDFPPRGGGRVAQFIVPRAQHRHTDRSSMSRETLWEELEWRFRRGVANRVSMDLIAAGLATPSLRISMNFRSDRNVPVSCQLQVAILSTR